jgi:hypothetical protein
MLNKILNSNLKESLFQDEFNKKICFLNMNYPKFPLIHYYKNKLYENPFLKKIKNQFTIEIKDFLCVNLKLILEENGFIHMDKNKLPFFDKIGFNNHITLNSTDLIKDCNFDENDLQKMLNILKYYYTEMNKYNYYSEEKIMEIIKITYEIMEIETKGNEKLIYTNKILREISDIFINNIFYEKYINYKIEKNTSLKQIKTNYIPYLDTEQGYLEFDGIYINKESGELYLVECKNTFEFKLNDLKEFLGACQIIEKAYGIKTKKLLFTTGGRNTKTKEFEKINFNKELYLFDLDDFKKDYSNLKEKLSFLL